MNALTVADIIVLSTLLDRLGQEYECECSFRYPICGAISVIQRELERRLLE